MPYSVATGTCLTFVIISWIVNVVDAGGCPANGFPIVEMCKGGSASSGTVLMDFFGASSYPASVCKCEALILKGRSFQFSQVAAPGYQGCGTEIHIQKNVGGDQGGSILKCYGGTSIDVKAGDSLTITLYKHAPPTDTRYCYRIDITGNIHAAVSLTCTKTPTPSPLPQPPTTIRDTSQGQPSTSETTPLLKTKTSTDSTGNDTIMGLQEDGFVHYVTCNNTNYFTAVVLLTVCLGLLSIYAIIATYKLLQRRNSPNIDEPSTSTDIYEEIPAKMYISSTPVYRDSFNSQTSSSPRFKDPLPDIPPSRAPCHSCSNVSLIPIQENSSSVWNWTYNDDKNVAAIISGVKDTQSEPLPDNYDIPSLDCKQEYEFPKFQYENARF